MKIGILSRNSALYSTRRLIQAARTRGHEACTIDTMKVAVNIGRSRAADADQALPDVDAIVPRIGASVTFYGLAVVRQFESKGVLTTATSSGIGCSRDKLHSLQIMSQSGLPTPNSTIVADPGDVWQAIEIAGGLPVIIKLIRGTQGQGVFLASEFRTVEAILKLLRRVREQMLVQEFIREAQGSDIRVIVVGKRCVAAMQRTAAAGEFRSNLHLGGSASIIRLDQHTRDLASQAAVAHGLDVAGVDLIQSDRGPLLLEVNSSPGLEGIETTTGVDVAGEIIRFLEREEKKRKNLRQQRRQSNRRKRDRR